MPVVHAIATDTIEQRIVEVRGVKVLLDSQLAELYGVETKYLKRAVRRNRERFPDDFVLELTLQEVRSLRCHSGTLKRGAHSKYRHYAFTEQGVAMLSSVLNSSRAIQVNVEIMRVFVRLRRLMVAQGKIVDRLNDLESRVDQHDEHIRAIFDAIRQLISPDPPSERRTIGY